MSGLFIEQLGSNPTGYLSWVVVVMFSICAHEYSHAAMAWRMGDDTAARSGHLTLNPLKQMGPRSLIMLAILGIAWGAVPVNPNHMTRPGRGWTAFAGPAMNLGLSMIFAVVAAVVAAVIHTREGAANLLIQAAAANAVLFMLNMLPVPSFDGWTVLGAFIPALDRKGFPPQVTLILFLILIGTPVLSHLWLAGYACAGFLFETALQLVGGTV